MARASLREDLLAAGVAMMHERGFSASGIRDIVQAAGVPLGSFTNHFPSKEGFALAVLDRYFERLSALMNETLRDESLPPLYRLDAYFAEIDRLARPVSWGYGCMVANFGLEMPVLSEVIRQRLVDIFKLLTEPFIEVLRAGQFTGDVRGDCDANDLAMLVLAGWHGAVLRAKVERSGNALSSYWRTMRSLITSSTSSAG
jgi:TetR/AcrR family transcriptional repressor of nem operon